MLLYVSLALAAAPTTHPALDALIADAKLHGTTSLYIVQDGVPLVDFQRGSDTPVRMMSVTKSVAALAVAKLRDSGQLPDVQAPLSTWLPDLPEPARSVPLDAVLSMTSGLDPCDDLSRCGNGGDAIAIAGALTRVAPVGTWAYTNTAVNLVSAVVGAVAGEPLDSFIGREVFRPLGITDARWERDDRGLPYVAAGLSLTAHDLARVGEMMLGDGQRDGVRVLNPGTVGWLTETTPSVPMYGKLWWAVPAGRLSQSGALLDYISAVGGDASAVDRLRPLVGRRWWDEMELRQDQIAALGGGAAGESAWRGLAFHAPLWDADPTLYGYAAEGYCGQYLVVVPEAKLVAVRLRRIGGVFVERDQDPNDLPDWPMKVVRAALKDAGK